MAGSRRPCTHATTRRVVAEHFAEERPKLQPLPAEPFQAVLRLEWRITRDGMILVDGNPYSVPEVIAVHPVVEGRVQRRVAAGHRMLPRASGRSVGCCDREAIPRPGEVVVARDLAFYEAVGKRLAIGALA